MWLKLNPVRPPWVIAMAIPQVLLRPVRITAVPEKRKPSLDRVEPEPDELVGHPLRVRDLAAINLDQLPRIDLEAELRLPLPP